jgi:hypothetical protein
VCPKRENNGRNKKPEIPYIKGLLEKQSILVFPFQVILLIPPAPFYILLAGKHYSKKYDKQDRQGKAAFNERQ